MRKILPFVLFMLVVSFGFAGNYSGGSGTKDDPFLISTANDLLELSSTSADWKWKTFKLIADIDMTGKDFTPIGNNITRFESTLDGNYYTISNLTITPTGANDGTGLIGFLGGTVKNLGVVNITVNAPGTNRVGAIAGIVGWGDIENCYSESGTINVGGGGWAGGIVGVIFGGATGSIKNCFSSVDITAAWGSAGILGANKSDVELENVAFFGTLNNGKAIVNQESDQLPVNAYFAVSSGVDDPNGTGIQDADLNKKSSYPGFDFTSNWRIDCKKGYAVLFNALKRFPVYLNSEGQANITTQWVDSVGEFNLGANIQGLSQTLFTCDDIVDSLTQVQAPSISEVKMYFTNASSENDTCILHISVKDTVAPIINPIENIEVDANSCETNITYPEIVVNDNCNVQLTQLEGLGPNGSFPAGVTTETWMATDPQGNSSTVTFTVSVTVSNAAPTINPAADVVVDEDTASVTIELSGISDGGECETQDVSVTATVDNTDLLTSLNTNYTPNEATGNVVVNIAPDKNGVANVIIAVTDSEGATTTDTVQITVNAVNDAPVLINPIADQTINASKVLDLTISSVPGNTFGDIDDASLTIDVMLEGGAALPAWATISNDVLTMNPMIADTGCVNVVVTATDAAGASVSDTFSVCVEGYAVSAMEIGQDVFDVEMYPNPTRGKINLVLNAGQIYDVDLTVTDITGKMVYRHQYSATERITFDMSDKVSGMYFVQLEVEGTQIVKKLIVDKK